MGVGGGKGLQNDWWGGGGCQVKFYPYNEEGGRNRFSHAEGEDKNVLR